MVKDGYLLAHKKGGTVSLDHALSREKHSFINYYHHSNSMSYYELWNILIIWKKEFTSTDFSRTFASPDYNKVLHDMAKKGMLERTGFGKYRVRTPAEYVSSKIDLSKAYGLLNDSKMEYALTDVDSVFIWTKGGYQVGRFFGFFPIHLKVRDVDTARWKRFFSSSKQRYIMEGAEPKETLFGLFYVLHPDKQVRAEDVDGLKVEPLKEVVGFCKKNIFSYQPALEMLDEMHGLRLGVKYRETRTNFW